MFVLQGNCPKVSSINDRSDWKVVLKAMSVIGFNDEEVEVKESQRLLLLVYYTFLYC